MAWRGRMVGGGIVIVAVVVDDDIAVSASVRGTPESKISFRQKCNTRWRHAPRVKNFRALGRPRVGGGCGGSVGGNPGVWQV